MGKFHLYGNSRYQAMNFRVVHPRKLKWRGRNSWYHDGVRYFHNFGGSAKSVGYWIPLGTHSAEWISLQTYASLWTNLSANERTPRNEGYLGSHGSWSSKILGPRAFVPQVACLLFRDCGDPITTCFLRVGMMLQVGCLDLIKNPGENLQHLPSLRRLRVLYQHHGWLDLCRCEFQRRRWVQKNNGILSRNLTWNLKKSPIKKRKNHLPNPHFWGSSRLFSGAFFQGFLLFFSTTY